MAKQQKPHPLVRRTDAGLRVLSGPNRDPSEGRPKATKRPKTEEPRLPLTERAQKKLQSEREAHAIRSLVPRSERQSPSDYDFRSWAEKKATSHALLSVAMLRLGMLYEYARETGTLRELLAVCQQHESEQKKRWPASEGRDWHCARHGFTEKDAERAIGKQWAGLRTLAEGLVKNIPFGELSFEQRQRAALNVQSGYALYSSGLNG